MDIKERMKSLIDKLNEAARAYYSDEKEIMTNLEYDTLYDELVSMEKESGIILSGSPTQRVGYEVISELPKVRHASPMKSLDKTKDIEALKSFLGNEKGMLSWKLDGLTSGADLRGRRADSGSHPGKRRSGRGDYLQCPGI